MHRSRLYISLLLCMLATACTQPDRKPGEDGGASTFYVDEAGGSANPGRVRDGSPWSIPTSIDGTFSACLKDNSSRRELLRQKFFVSIPGTNKGFDVETNNTGCLQWTEELPYNHYAGRSSWVTVTRVLQGRGVNTGSVELKFGVNPWATGNDDVRDRGKAVLWLSPASKERPTQLVEDRHASAFLLGDYRTQGAGKLWIKDVSVKAFAQGKESSKFTTYLYHIEMKPKIEVYDAYGIKKYLDVNDGDFDIDMHLLAADMGPQLDQRSIILAGEPRAVGRVKDRTLSVELTVRQDFEAVQSNMELALRIRPRSLSGNMPIREYNGVFYLGSYTSVASASGPIANKCVEDQTACNFDKVVSSARNFEALKAAGYLRPKERYIFSNLRLRFLMIQPGETATQRTVAYTASTCITDTEARRPLANTPMIIRYKKREGQSDANIEREVINKKTDESGCLNWDGLAFHKYYKPEEYFEREITIEKASEYSKDFRFYINPWDTNINFGFDEREFTETKIEEIRRRTPVPSRFFLGGYSYHTVKFLYNIDPFMELEVKKTVLMELVPEVLRYSGIKDARKMTEHLRDGIYLLKVGIQKSYLDPRDNSHLLIQNDKFKAQQVLRANEKHVIVDKQDKQNRPKTRDFVTTNVSLVRVVSGIIIVPIELTMRDLRLMRVRSNFMIQLETVDERMVQAYHVFKKFAVNDQDLATRLAEFRQKLQAGRSLLEEVRNRPPQPPEPPPVDKLLEDRKAKEQLGAREEKLHPELEQLTKERLKDGVKQEFSNATLALQDRVERAQSRIKLSLDMLKDRFEKGGALGFYLNSQGQSTDVPLEVLNDELITTNFQAGRDMLNELRDSVRRNDFSLVALPKREDIDPEFKNPRALDIFVEKGSGLEPRSFVGPVIFLSNAYSDSARATDNLDEEECKDPNKPADVLKESEAELSEIQKILNTREKAAAFGFNKGRNDDSSGSLTTDRELEGKRLNNAYRRDPYFGSLSHLCYKQVDDLIKMEQELKQERELNNSATSMKSNFLDYASRVMKTPLEYVSLTNEPLRERVPGCVPATDPKCVEDRTASQVKVEDLDKWVNQPVESSGGWLTYLNDLKYKLYDEYKVASGPYFSLEGLKSVPSRWTPEMYPDLFFNRNVASHIGLCSMLANRITGELAQQSLIKVDQQPRMRFEIMKVCSNPQGLVHDIKYRVEQTGPYNFLGGMNLNINVGTSFSTSWSYSAGGGVEFSDYVSPLSALSGVLKVPLGSLLIKPLSLKAGWSMSDSEGTSISESTYLVSQLAGFELDLVSYEKCAIVSLSPKALFTRDPNDPLKIWSVVPKDSLNSPFLKEDLGLKKSLMEDERTSAILRRGFFVCEGSTRKMNPTAKVKEMFFYFTQHFTEGDMLDQADLYNHPWLLPMRGLRDFYAFTDRVQGEKVAGLGPFLKNLTNQAPKREKAWALGHMSNVYHHVLPTFPGFYTVLPAHENIEMLLDRVQQPLEKNDSDPLGEVVRRELGKIPGTVGQGTQRR